MGAGYDAKASGGGKNDFVIFAMTIQDQEVSKMSISSLPERDCCFQTPARGKKRAKCGSREDQTSMGYYPQRLSEFHIFDFWIGGDIIGLGSSRPLRCRCPFPERFQYRCGGATFRTFMVDGAFRHLELEIHGSSIYQRLDVRQC